jgi:AcrR family transcriptional regulator
MNVKRAKRLSRSETAAQTRDRLLDAGARVFAGEGFYGATVEDIAEAAGYTRGAFYAHFVDKADLLLTLLEERDRAGLDDLEARLEDPTGGEQIDATTSWFADRFTLPSALDRAVAEFSAGGIANPEHAARMRGWFETARGRVTAMVEDGFARAGVDVPGDPERLATMMVALVNGYAMLRHLDPDAATPELFGAAILYLGEGALASASRER